MEYIDWSHVTNCADMLDLLFLLHLDGTYQDLELDTYLLLNQPRFKALSRTLEQ